MKYHRLSGMVLLIITEILKFTLSSYPAWVEKVYTGGIFIFWSYFFNFFSFVFVFPGVIFVPLGYLSLLIYQLFYKEKVYLKIIWLINSLGLLYFLFYLFWGFNYYRLPIDHSWKYRAEPFTAKQLKKEYEETTLYLLKVRNLLADTSSGIPQHKINLQDSQYESVLQYNLRGWLKNNGYSLAAEVPIRSELPKGFFLHFSTTGMYFPYSREGNADPGLHPLHYISVMAHEMAHGYGFADEGTCNFLAYICHHQDKNARIAYATTLGYWRYLATNIRRIAPDFFQRKIKELPTGLKSDLLEIQEFSNRYEDWMPQLQYKIYDTYLKGQGIREGMLNYNRVIGLVLAYKAANPFIFDASSTPK
jgi:hypothetical protein